jgi:hypothetical protein
MRSLPLLALLLALGSSLFAADPALTPIFNGRDLTGWSSPDMEKFWRAENGVLIGESNAELKGHYLWTEKSYGDFVLEFEVRWTGEVDTGVEFRVPHIQLQLGISRSLKRDMSGSLYTGKYPEAGQAKHAARLLKPPGEWNHFRLEAKGPVFTVDINGHPAVNYTDEKFTGPGPLGLQLHQGVKMKVEYRNIRVADGKPET